MILRGYCSHFIRIQLGKGGKDMFFGHWYLQKGIFGPSRQHYLSKQDILLKTVEQTWLTIKKLCDFQEMGGVEEFEARNYLPKKEKS